MSERGSPYKRRFFDVLKREWAPELRSWGFKGSGGKFRRIRDPFIDCIWVQESTAGGRCRVLGVHLTFMPTSTGSSPDIKKIEEPDYVWRRRLSEDGEVDHWWAYGNSEKEAEKQARELIQLYRQVGEPHFQYFDSLPGPFAHVTPEDIRSTDLPAFQNTMMTRTRAALFLADMHQHLGNRELAIDFARTALETTDKSKHRALKARLERIMKESG